ncbi:hypothetical protein [Janthinobacterium sp. LB2P70]|uniref:hypothetical protein n=1 Tax=Janthinobacterium sp. LB2P70 TaxID=3424197 RepID=UPI003F235EA9
MTRINFREFVLGAMPGTKADIVIKSGVSQAAVLRWIRLLHADRKICIASWKPHPRAGATMAVYAVGKGNRKGRRLLSSKLSSTT